MEQLEKVEKIREKTGVTYQEAKAALEEANGDILDAVVILEKQGKIKAPEVHVFTTEEETKNEEFQKAAEAASQHKGETFGGMMHKFLNWCKVLIKKGCENFFIVERHGSEVISAPVIVLAVLLLCAFWVVLPILIIGLFFGFRYSFKGEITKTVDVNQACDIAAETCESIKKEFNKKKDN